MDWWNDFTQWLVKPVSNGTVIAVALLLGWALLSAATQIASRINARMSYLGSVLEAIANRKPWPW